ncbi:hypothetical protein DM02DRAFT_673339 [Periconia macrospinosa]|uniref:Rhodopsin domain-containing protein n=1 Tax=Periconia macrospinosa TaxID=97972 RepID=A0A2V1DK53_9PLEO|nr:hypothetical protein DM02DRAFT_673339 [Periconia macrospinosa]
MPVANIHIGPAWLWTAATIFPAVCILIVGARLATRHAQRARFGPDDWCMVPALIIVLGMAATILVGVGTESLGHPTPKVEGTSQLAASSRQQTITRKAFFIITLISTPTLTFLKLSCVFFYKRVFATGSGPAVNIAIHALTAITILWGCGFFFGWLFGCGTHFDYYWTSLENQLKCPADLAKINLSLAISNFLIDFMLMLLPIPLIASLQISKANKLATLFIFALGGLAVAASITRMVIIVEELDVQFAMTVDPNFASTAGIYFIYIEACFALCAVCLPSLAGMFKLREVQNMIEGFSMARSNLSRGSLRSHGSRGPGRSRTRDHERLGSHRPSADDIESMFDPRGHDGNGIHFAVQKGDIQMDSMHNAENETRDAIQVTKSVNLESSRR